jgi:hypothetical protein
LSDAGAAGGGGGSACFVRAVGNNGSGFVAPVVLDIALSASRVDEFSVTVCVYTGHVRAYIIIAHRMITECLVNRFVTGCLTTLCLRFAAASVSNRSMLVSNNARRGSRLQCDVRRPANTLTQRTN